MEFLRVNWWLVAIVPVVIGLVLARWRAGGHDVDAGSTLSPGKDNGSWDMTAALPMCPVCESPMVLRNARRGTQAWACSTPQCKGVAD